MTKCSKNLNNLTVMRRVFAKILLLIIIIMTVSVNSVGTSAYAEFDIVNGILIKYNGNSNIVTVPTDVWKVGDSAFEGNSDIIAVNLNSNISAIGNSAFYNCTSLQEINNADGVVDIGAYAFNNTAFVNRSSQDFVSVNNILIKYKGTDNVVDIPQNIESIAPYTFANNMDIVQVNIGDNVFSIGEGAFYNCYSMVKANIPDSVESIGALAFTNTVWISLTRQDFVVVGNGLLIGYNGVESKITLPDDVRQVCDSAFDGNSVITEVAVSEGCVLIGARAFGNCPNLVKVALPNSVIGINEFAFADSNAVGISASEGSFAYDFAVANDMVYKETLKAGDVNSDGDVNSQDATLVLQYYAQIIESDADFDTSMADMNNDNVINSQDATLILQIYAGILQM